MSRTLELDLPTTDAITSGLELLTCFPALAEAEQQLVAAEVALSDARQALEDATTVVDGLPAKVHAGKAEQADLEQAISAQKATEVMLPHHERDVAEVQEALAEAKRQARGAVVEEARRRRDALQEIADQISPVLEELRALEAALREAIATHAPELADAGERSAAVKLAPPIDGVRWAVSNGVTNRLRAGTLLSGPEIEVRR